LKSLRIWGWRKSSKAFTSNEGPNRHQGFKGRRDPEPFEGDSERIEMIQVTAKVYSILRQIIGKPTLVVDVPENSSVKDVLDKVVDDHKGSFEQNYLWTAREQEYMKYLIVFVNGQQIPHSEGLETKVKEGDTVDFLEPLSMG
jgi:molybdopterin converting factor small subunit